MKHLLMTGLLLATTSAFASSMKNIDSMTNKTLESARAEIAHTDLVTHSGIKKVLILKGNGKTAQEVRENAVAQAMHTAIPGDKISHLKFYKNFIYS